MNKPRLSIVARITGIGGATLAVAVLLATQLQQGVRDQQLGLIKWGSRPSYEAEGWYDVTAQYDWVAFSLGAFDFNADKVDSLVVRNVDIMVGTYFNAITDGPWGRKAPEGYTIRAMTDTIRGRYAITTEGDTASIWKNFPMYDFFDEDVVNDVTDVLADYVVTNKLDWVFIDHFNVVIPDLMQWQPEFLPFREGDPDLDRDGIGHWDDLDEQEAYRIKCAEFINIIRSKLPPSVKLIPNGSLAMRDDSFSLLTDGCFIENFPQHFFGSQDPNWENAFDPDYPFSVYNIARQDRYRNGNGIVFLCNTGNSNWTGIDIPEIKNVAICYWHKDQFTGSIPPTPWELRNVFTPTDGRN